MSKFDTLGEYNQVVWLLTTHLQGFMAEALGECTAQGTYLATALLWSDVDHVMQIAMEQLHQTDTLAILQSDFSRMEILEDTLAVSQVVIDGLVASPFSKQVLSGHLRTALLATIQLVANRVAGIESIPGWSVLNIPEQAAAAEAEQAAEAEDKDGSSSDSMPDLVDDDSSSGDY